VERDVPRWARTVFVDRPDGLGENGASNRRRGGGARTGGRNGEGTERRSRSRRPKTDKATTTVGGRGKRSTAISIDISPVHGRRFVSVAGASDGTVTRHRRPARFIVYGVPAAPDSVVNLRESHRVNYSRT